MTDVREVAVPQSAGGYARAGALTAQERREIAKRAAEARWSPDKQLPRATHEGVLKVGDLELPCYNVNDGRRVLSRRGMISALGMKDGTNPRVGADRLLNFATGKRIKPHINASLAALIEHPILFRTARGTEANGYEATALADLCSAVMEAALTGGMQLQQRHIVERCRILQSGFAKLGIIALVDEATGYQEIRPRDALQEYLAMFLRKELAAWSKKFPDEFYQNIYKLKSWPWHGMSKNRYSVVAQYTRNLVYERIAPSLLETLEAKSPPNQKGERKNKLHQWLTSDVGDPMLAQHLHALLMLQRLAIANGHGWKRFVRSVDQVLPRKGDTLHLPLVESDPEQSLST